jgi:hypothetical protein
LAVDEPASDNYDQGNHPNDEQAAGMSTRHNKLVASGSSCRKWSKSRSLRKLTATRLNLLSLSERDRGWRAASPGKHWVRLVFDQPQSIKRIRLQFNETEVARTQEFSMQWSGCAGDSLKEAVRQQWNFSPDSSEIESEDYQVHLKAISILELTIDPDLGAGEAVATLADWRLA